MTQRDIQQVLSLQSPQVFRSSPYRKNLHLQIVRVWTPASRRDRLQSFIQAQGSMAGLVYTHSRRDSETLATWLQTQGHCTAAYHTGLDAKQCRAIEQQWLTGAMPFVICTSVFGMGVDKPNVRYAMSARTRTQPQKSLEDYLSTRGCRWQFLLEAFGFGREAQGLQCGHCDRCCK